MPRFARNDGCEVTGLPRFPSVARNDERRGRVLLRHRTRVKSKKLSLTSSSLMREEEIITFSVFLAEEECGLPRFARNDGCEVTGLPRFARNDGCEVAGLPYFARNDGCEVAGLPRFPSVARNDEKRGKARLRVGTMVRFLSGGRKGVGTRGRFFAEGRQEVGTRVRFLSGGRKEVGMSMRFLSGSWQEVGTSMRFLSGRWQGGGTRRNVDCSSCFGRL